MYQTASIDKQIVYKDTGRYYGIWKEELLKRGYKLVDQTIEFGEFIRDEEDS